MASEFVPGIVARCAECKRFAAEKDSTLCSRCTRLAAIGTLVECIKGDESFRCDRITDYAEFEEATWAGLDAIALLLIERGRLVRRHNREMVEEQREAGRAASSAHADGYREGREAESW